MRVITSETTLYLLFKISRYTRGNKMEDKTAGCGLCHTYWVHGRAARYATRKVFTILHVIFHYYRPYRLPDPIYKESKVQTSALRV